MTRLIPYAAFQAILLSAAYISYLRAAVFSFILAVFMWLAVFPALVSIGRMNGPSAALSLLIFNILQAAFLIHRAAVRRSSGKLAERLEQMGARSSALYAELAGLSKTEAGIKEKELAIANLYEITKKMSEYLKFEEIFAPFSEFLERNFKFSGCELLIIGHDSEGPRVERVYTLRRDAQKADRPQKVSHDGLVKMFLENPKEAFILNKKDASSGSFAAVPLLSEKKMVGILSIEGLARSDVENFVILSAQFALEIKKVLLYEMVERLAITDSLTGLYLRRYFSERVGEELQRSRRHKLKFAFLMIDIDDFKKFNDNHGHLVGDVILKELGRIMKESVREIDLIARYGGEELAIVLPETGPDNARAVAERLRKRVEENIFRAYDEKLKTTVSIGMAIYPSDAENLSGLIGRADEALYKAKRDGKNVVCEYKKVYNKKL